MQKQLILQHKQFISHLSYWYFFVINVFSCVWCAYFSLFSFQSRAASSNYRLKVNLICIFPKKLLVIIIFPYHIYHLFESINLITYIVLFYNVLVIILLLAVVVIVVHLLSFRTHISISIILYCICYRLCLSKHYQDNNREKKKENK